MNKIIFSSLIAIFLIGLSCDKDNPSDGGKSPCGGIDPLIIPESPYSNPIWHPSGKFIGFNHTPLVNITYPYGEGCWGEQHFSYDSTGFWLIDSDGTNMHRIFPHTLQNPVWSPDGEWIAYVSGAQIFKMKFTGTTFDTATIVQLTNGGRNFFPAWSPDGEWIAYNRSICEGPSTCGIWMMSASGQNQRFLAAYGNYPDWHRYATKVLYRTRAITRTGQPIGDSLWQFDISTNSRGLLTVLSGINLDNRYPKYSPNGTKIAFWSSGNLWIMDSTGSNLLQLTTTGVDVDFGLPFSWSPVGDKIIYTRYQSTDWTMKNGVLWTIDVNSKIEKQFTFNP
ncbi:MAG: DPP IV N-terminal domain-containing protein [Bacteroidota bacterium]|nr:DPP IV N-terminal domain-containing protein [Bacteroidota bacterium]